jgi:hypothetical protein
MAQLIKSLLLTQKKVQVLINLHPFFDNNFR